jgi:hypothetical protein
MNNYIEENLMKELLGALFKVQDAAEKRAIIKTIINSNTVFTNL